MVLQCNYVFVRKDNQSILNFSFFLLNEMMI